jgi:hypothetical protein
VSTVEGSVALLEQQELLETPPARRLIVPKGHGSWMGVDPGTLRVAITSVYLNTASQPVYRPRTVSFAPLEGGARLEAIWTDTRLFVKEEIEHGRFAAPGIVFVEQPSGKQPNPQLSYATGVIIGAVFAGVQDATGHRVLVETCASGWWKRVATGRGNWSKPTRKSLGRTPVFGDYGVARWAEANGYAGRSWDEADSMGAAEAARRTVALEER